MTKQEKRDELVKAKLEEIKATLEAEGEYFDAAASHTYLTPEMYAEIDNEVNEQGEE